MISFVPAGSVQIKINLCSCESCLIGNFVNCVHEPGVQVGSKLINYHNGGSESESESDTMTFTMIMMKMKSMKLEEIMF